MEEVLQLGGTETHQALGGLLSYAHTDNKLAGGGATVIDRQT